MTLARNHSNGLTYVPITSRSHRICENLTGHCGRGCVRTAGDPGCPATPWVFDSPSCVDYSDVASAELLNSRERLR